MKFKSQIIVIGAKASKGEMEGTPYDHTTIFTTTLLDAKNDDAMGVAGDSYRFGKSDNFQKLKGIPCPFQAEAEFEIVTTGKTSRTIMLDLKPLPSSVKA